MVRDGHWHCSKCNLYVTWSFDVCRKCGQKLIENRDQQHYWICKDDLSIMDWNKDTYCKKCKKFWDDVIVGFFDGNLDTLKKTK